MKSAVYKRQFLKTCVVCISSLCMFKDVMADEIVSGDVSPNTRPNIVIILADDLGYGDVQAYNAQSKVKTPSIDKLADEGMRFTDMHSPSAVCTPTRYSLLTGRYAWRTHLKEGVLWGYSPLMIDINRETIPSMLQKQGYHTAGIGKWHLGLGRGEADYYAPIATSDVASSRFGGITPGPNEVGFDHFFGIPASLDMKPYLFIENGSAEHWIDGTLVESSDRRKNGGGGYWRKGQIAKGFDFQQVLPVLTNKAVEYIDQRAKKADQPFFLYFALTSPHTPWLPSDEFKGKSGAGYYGDFVAHTDNTVGKVIAALEKNGLSDNTLVIVTSDNGAHWADTDIKQYAHLANGELRGQKADIHEGGHRVPFVAKWPRQIKEGSVSQAVGTLADLFSTISDITGFNQQQDDGPDGDSLLPAFAGHKSKTIESRAIIHHSLDGMFAIRQGDWKLIEGLGSGGFTKPARETANTGQPKFQLYNLADDPKEQNNVAKANPNIVNALHLELRRIRAQESEYRD